MGRLSQVCSAEDGYKIVIFSVLSVQVLEDRAATKEFGERVWVCILHCLKWRCKTLRLGNPVAEGEGGLRKILQTNFGRGATFLGDWHCEEPRL